MDIFIIQRTKSLIASIPLFQKLELLNGDGSVHILSVKTDACLALKEHVLRLRLQWLKLKNQKNRHVIASSTECEILGLWLESHPQDFDSATFINATHIRKRSIWQSFKKIVQGRDSILYRAKVYLDSFIARVVLPPIPLLFLESESKAYKQKRDLIDRKGSEDKPYVLDIIRHRSSSLYLEDDEPQWVASQIYTWINRERHS